MGERERLRDVVKRRSGFLLHSFVTVTSLSGLKEHYFLTHPCRVSCYFHLFCLLSCGNCLIISHAVRWKSWALTLLPLFFFSPHGPTDLLRGLKAWSGSGESHLLISFNTLVSGCVCVWFRIPSLQNRRKPGDRGGRLTERLFLQEPLHWSVAFWGTIKDGSFEREYHLHVDPCLPGN